MIRINEYRKVESLEEAFTLNQKKANCIIGGMLWLKMGKRNVQTAIDLSGLGLDTIEENEEEFRIGCMVTLRDMELHKGLEEYTEGAVRESLRHIVGVQFRNLATVGGSIYGRYGFSDVLTMLMVMDSYVELYKGGIIPLEEFAKQKYDRDVLVRIVIKKTPGKFYYQSVRNTKTDFPVLTCAAASIKEEKRIAIGARPARAILLTDKNQILSGDITLEKAEQFSRYIAQLVPATSNLRGSKEYRSHLVKVLTKRAVCKLGGIIDAD